MCAEIYIEKLFNENRSKVERYLAEAIALRDAEFQGSNNRELAHREVVEWEQRMYDNAYFRDPYDGLCLLNQLGLSYMCDVAIRLDANDQLHREGITWLLREVSGRRLDCRLLRTEEFVLAHELRSEDGDDFKAMDFYQNLGDFTMSPQEKVRLKAHELEAKHPELWAESTQFPNRIYSGKQSTGQKLFLAYRVVTGFDSNEPDKPPLTDVRWFMIDRESQKIQEGLEDIHQSIECTEGTARVTNMPTAERTRLRKMVEAKALAQYRFRAGIPDDYKDELICWMEI